MLIKIPPPQIDLLENLIISLINPKFVMIYTIHKMLALYKSHLNFLKNSLFEYSFKECDVFF